MSYHLTKEQIQKLKKQYYKNRGHRFVNRIRVVIAFAHGYTVSELALIFILDCDTIRRYSRLYKEGGIKGLVEEYRKKLGKIKFVFLPPYSPNLNIVERIWKFFKKKKSCTINIMKSSHNFQMHV
jgi:hypothetical protein